MGLILRMIILICLFSAKSWAASTCLNVNAELKRLRSLGPITKTRVTTNIIFPPSTPLNVKKTFLDSLTANDRIEPDMHDEEYLTYSCTYISLRKGFESVRVLEATPTKLVLDPISLSKNYRLEGSNKFI